MASTGRMYSLEIKNEIIHFHGMGQCASEICRSLKSDHGYQTTRQGVQGFINRVSTTGSIHRQRKSDMPAQQKVTDVHLQFLDMWMEDNPELTAQALQKRFDTTFRLHISISRLKYYRKSLSWQSRRMKYCQLISHVNKRFRLNWCLEALLRRETFANVIFTAESSIELSSSGRLFFYKQQSALQNLPWKAPKPKHAYKVHMWAGISYHGRTDCCLFTGIMDSVIYQKILSENLLPFAEAKFPNGYRLYQDNDSKHKSKSTMMWMGECGLQEKLVVTPASSPDINLIENVWSALKDHLQRQVKPKRKDELIHGITEFWEALSAELCGKYIDHIHRVIPATCSFEQWWTNCVLGNF